MHTTVTCSLVHVKVRPSTPKYIGVCTLTHCTHQHSSIQYTPLACSFLAGYPHSLLFSIPFPVSLLLLVNPFDDDDMCIVCQGFCVSGRMC